MGPGGYQVLVLALPLGLFLAPPRPKKRKKAVVRSNFANPTAQAPIKPTNRRLCYDIISDREPWQPKTDGYIPRSMMVSCRVR